MTTAICIYCGAMKFGAFVPCHECDRLPQDRDEVVRSLALTDHHFTVEALSKFGEQIKSGNPPAIDPSLEETISQTIEDSMLAQLTRLSDPAQLEACRRRETNIILAIMAALIGGIAWMLYRFAVS